MAFLPTVFDPNQWDPAQGGGGQLPVGPKQPVVIQSADGKVSKDGASAYMEFTLRLLEGPSAGKTGPYRLNLQHENPVTVKIAHQQLSAICHAIGYLQPMQDVTPLFEKPFRVDVEPQPQNPDKYTQVTRIYDINGNEPKAGGQVLNPGHAQAAQGFQGQQQAQPQANGWQGQQGASQGQQQAPPQANGWANQGNQQPASPAGNYGGPANGMTQQPSPAQQFPSNQGQQGGQTGMSAGWAGQQQPQGQTGGGAGPWANQQR